MKARPPLAGPCLLLGAVLLVCACAKRPWTDGVSHEQPLTWSKHEVAMWVWETVEILKDPVRTRELVEFSVWHGIDRVFLQIPMPPGEPASAAGLRALGPLIAQLHANGIGVDALDGDPGYIEPEHQERVLATIDAVVEYNRGAPPEQRFSAFRLDVEPHASKRFATDRRGALQDYLALLSRSRERLRGTGLGFGVDIPFWFDTEPIAWGSPGRHHRTLSHAVIERADNVCVLTYRTRFGGRDGVEHLLTDELRMAYRRGTSLYIGLDTTLKNDDTSFRGLGESHLIYMMELAAYHLQGHPALRGFAVHSYKSLKELHGPAPP